MCVAQPWMRGLRSERRHRYCWRLIGNTKWRTKHWMMAILLMTDRHTLYLSCVFVHGAPIVKNVRQLWYYCDAMSMGGHHKRQSTTTDGAKMDPIQWFLCSSTSPQWPYWFTNGNSLKTAIADIWHVKIHNRQTNRCSTGWPHFKIPFLSKENRKNPVIKSETPWRTTMDEIYFHARAETRCHRVRRKRIFSKTELTGSRNMNCIFLYFIQSKIKK